MPNSLLGNPKGIVVLTKTKKWRPIINRWFSLSIGAISLAKVPLAAAIALFMILFIGCRNSNTLNETSETINETIKRPCFTLILTTPYTFTYEDNIYPVVASVNSLGNFANESEVKKAYEEMIQLIEEGKAEEVSPCIYKAVLSNGKEASLGRCKRLRSIWPIKTMNN